MPQETIRTPTHIVRTSDVGTRWQIAIDATAMIEALERELQMQQPTNQTAARALASLPEFRAPDSAAMAPPEDPPARSGEAADPLCETGASAHQRIKFAKKRMNQFLSLIG